MHPVITHIKNHKVGYTMLAIFILATVLRFAFLDMKLYHHDETIHAWFSYNLMNSGDYVYDPVYHGPFLYYVTAGMFSLFGDSDLIGRILPCVFGCAIIPLIYWIYKMKYLSGKTACIAALFVAIAPQMVYFSRFLRNDVFVIFFSLLMIAAFLAYIRKSDESEGAKKGNRWYFLALVGLVAALGLCCKENMPLIIVTFGLFFVYLWWTKKITLPEKFFRDAIIALVIFFAVVFTLYTSFWQYPTTVFTAGFDAISHWFAMHSENRIPGPPVFYLLCFILYEPAILILAIVGTVLFIVNPAQRKKRKLNELSKAANTDDEQNGEENAGAFESSNVCAGAECEKKRGFSLKRLLTRPDAPQAVNKQTEFFRFAIYWTVIACITYGYIGEKVPWLSLHQLLPMIFVAAFAFMFFGKFGKIILIVSAVTLFGMMFYVAYTPADIAEPIIQVQYSENLVWLMNDMYNSDKVAIAGEAGWPFMWYFRGDDWNRIYYFGTRVDESTLYSGDYDIIIAPNTNSYEYLEGYDKSYILHQYWLDHWYIPDLWGWVKYYFTRFFTHEPIGGSYLDIFTKTTS